MIRVNYNEETDYYKESMNIYEAHINDFRNAARAANHNIQHDKPINKFFISNLLCPCLRKKFVKDVFESSNPLEHLNRYGIHYACQINSCAYPELKPLLRVFDNAINKKLREQSIPFSIESDSDDNETEVEVECEIDTEVDTDLAVTEVDSEVECEVTEVEHFIVDKSTRSGRAYGGRVF